MGESKSTLREMHLSKYVHCVRLSEEDIVSRSHLGSIEKASCPSLHLSSAVHLTTSVSNGPHALADPMAVQDGLCY